jgi:hypothetical protein
MFNCSLTQVTVAGDVSGVDVGADRGINTGVVVGALVNAWHRLTVATKYAVRTPESQYSRI